MVAAHAQKGRGMDRYNGLNGGWDAMADAYADTSWCRCCGASGDALKIECPIIPVGAGSDSE
jgi:hypothetical protein